MCDEIIKHNITVKEYFFDLFDGFKFDILEFLEIDS